GLGKYRAHAASIGLRLIWQNHNIRHPEQGRISLLGQIVLQQSGMRALGPQDQVPHLDKPRRRQLEHEMELRVRIHRLQHARYASRSLVYAHRARAIGKLKAGALNRAQIIEQLVFGGGHGLEMLAARKVLELPRLIDGKNMSYAVNADAEQLGQAPCQSRV